MLDQEIRKSAICVRNRAKPTLVGGFNLVSLSRWPRMRAACKTMLPYQSF
jgi:hypothetical protein